MQGKFHSWPAKPEQEEPVDYWLIAFLVLCCWVPFIVFMEMSGLLLGMTPQGLIFAGICLFLLMVLSVFIVNRSLSAR